MSEIETDSENNNSLEVIEKPKKKITQKQREAGIENLKKGPKSRETKIIDNKTYNINPYLEFEKLINPTPINTPIQEKNNENVTKNKNNDLEKLKIKELEKKLDIIANMHLDTNKKVNKMYEMKKAKTIAKIDEASKNVNKKNDTIINNDLYSRLANKIEQKIKKKI